MYCTHFPAGEERAKAENVAWSQLAHSGCVCVMPSQESGLRALARASTHTHTPIPTAGVSSREFRAESVNLCKFRSRALGQRTRKQALATRSGSQAGRHPCRQTGLDGGNDGEGGKEE